MKSKAKSATEQTEPFYLPQMILLDRLRPSPTQPRKRFPTAPHEELVASMRAHGFTLSALLVRPSRDSYRVDSLSENQHFLMRVTGGGEETVELFTTAAAAAKELKAHEDLYEIVAGERRYRAAKFVGIAEAPCIVRLLSDQEVLEIQLVENVQREDLTPMEEAEGLRRLLDLRDGEDQAVHSIATLAVKVGKSASYIERRVKLCVLAGEVRDAVEAGTLPARTAMLIAGVPDEKLRDKFAQGVMHPSVEEGPLTYRAADNLRREKFMRDLRTAGFAVKDADLVPVKLADDGSRIFGGACTDCPFRLGNTPDAAEIPPAQHNLCLQPKCYEAKDARGWQVWQEKETSADGKRIALPEAECRRLYCYGDQLAWGVGMVDLRECPDSMVLRPGADCAQPWKKLLGDADLQVSVAKDRNGKPHELVDRKLAVAAAILNGHGDVFKREAGEGAVQAATEAGAAMSAEAQEELRRRAAEAEAARQYEFKLTKRVRVAVAEQIGARAMEDPAVPCLQLLAALRNAYYHDADAEIAGIRGWGEACVTDDSEWDRRVARLSDADQRALLVQYLFLNSANMDIDEAKLLKVYGISGATVRKQVALDMKAEEKAAELEKAKESGGAALGWETPVPENFEWNEHGVCMNPMLLRLALPKAAKIASAEVTVAKDQDGWHWGYHFRWGKIGVGDGSSGGGPSQSALGYDSAEVALKTGVLHAIEWFTTKNAGAKIIEYLKQFAESLNSQKPSAAAKKKATIIKAVKKAKAKRGAAK